MNETSETVQRLCSQCNNTVDADARFCKYCGFDFANSNANVEENSDFENNPLATESKSSRNNTSFYVFSGIAVLAVLFIAGFIVLKSSNHNSQVAVVENSNANSTSPSPYTLSAKAQQIEEKILHGEALSASDLEGVSTSELRILRNVHFARYGRKYERPGLGDYFYTRSWYKPSDDYKDSMVNSTEKANINLILSLEKPTENTTSITTNVNSSPINEVPMPEKVASSFSEFPSSPGETAKQFHEAIFTHNVDWYVKYMKAAYKRSPDKKERDSPPSDEMIRASLDLMSSFRGNAAKVKSIEINKEMINGNKATVSLKVYRVDGSSVIIPEISLAKIDGMWIVGI